jgi:hypothetical protein
MADIAKEKMTEEERKRQRAMSEQLGDIEFQMEIAPYTNYTGPIDPSVARYRGFEGLPGDTNLTLGGFYAQPDSEENPYTEADLKGYEGSVDGIDVSLPVEPNTVNAVHNKATPNIWAHEYRHKENPGMSEERNRLADGILAMNERDWKSAVKFWKDKLMSKEVLKQARARKNGEKYIAKEIPTSEVERDLINKLDSDSGASFGLAQSIFNNEFKNKGGNLPESEENWYAPDEHDYQWMRREQTYWPKRKAELDEFDEWNNAIAKHNEERRKGNS